MNAKVRTLVMTGAVIAVLAGCASAPSGGTTARTTATHPACPEGSQYPPNVAGAVDFTDSIRHDSVNYTYLPSVKVTPAQVGLVVTRIQCSMLNWPQDHAVPAHWANDTATALTVGTPVHRVKGFSPGCRLAVYVSGQPRAYIAMNMAKHGPVPRPCAKVAAW